MHTPVSKAAMSALKGGRARKLQGADDRIERGISTYF